MNSLSLRAQSAQYLLCEALNELTLLGQGRTVTGWGPVGKIEQAIQLLDEPYDPSSVALPKSQEEK